MKLKAFKLLLAASGLAALTAASPAEAKNKHDKKLPDCSSLVEHILDKGKGHKDKGWHHGHRSGKKSLVLSATSEIIAATSSGPAYCEVNLTQYPAINVRVGLPLSDADGGAGGVQGNWNGKVQNLGGGGYAGNVGSVSIGSIAGPISDGYVISSTDTGHSPDWCNAIDPRTGQPNSQPNCGLAGGGFVLDANKELIKWQVRDFITDGIHAQTVWALDLSEMYYGKEARRNYWNGCSTGGRQGMEMAQQYGDLFDGILAGAPAMNWNRFIIGELWPPVVVKDLLGETVGLPASKYNAANAAAVAACDGNDGVVDGLINEPRRCMYNAEARLCSAIPGDPDCLSQAEADAINMIWDGPRNEKGERLWGGLTKGTSFGTLLRSDLAGPVADTIGLITTYVTNWMHEDPDFDWHTVTIENFAEHFQLSSRKFRETAATDDPDLDKLRKHGGKMIHYHGIGDPLIVPYGSYNYASRVFDRYGVEKTQKFMRSFFYPANGHCGGGTAGTPLINNSQLFEALVNWVENGVDPDYIEAANSTGNRTAKICSYPDETVYTGTGSTGDAANYKCVEHKKEPADLRAESQTARMYHEASDGGHGHGHDHDHYGSKHNDHHKHGRKDRH